MNYMITIYDLQKARNLQIPSLPEQISFSCGAKYVSYDIADLGVAEFPAGVEPKAVSWSGVFYGEAFKDFSPIVQKWKAPLEIQNLLNEWVSGGTKLKLVISNTPINMDVTLASFDMTYKGPYGNYEYTLSFKEYVDLKVTVIKKSTTTTTTQPETVRNIKPAPSTYTIKTGDTLWSIAYKYYKSGTKYTVIYNANKNTIESAAKKHGFSSSNNGDRIWAGTVLTIPNAG